jgi:hypothetical protein
MPQEKDDDFLEDKAALKDMAVINDENLLGGVPSKLIFAGIASTIGFLFVLRAVWYLAIIYAFIYFMTVFMMHADNPKAARGWMRALRRPVLWRAGWHKRRVVINLRDEESI